MKPGGGYRADQIQLLVLDIDGTIAGVSMKLSSWAIQAQSKERQVAINGRMYCSALQFHRDVGSTLPLLAYQGQFKTQPRSSFIATDVFPNKPHSICWTTLTNS